eukprot:Tbor_TRINITY_DN96_c0_g1::TRINITY_DN96_c0_g1_i1::g.15097::m.15097/K06965/PELO, DOM34, pelA; protein pelota
MRIIKGPIFTSDGAGEVKLYLSSIDDTWHFYNMVSKGDTVTSKTHRKVQIGTTGVSEKKVMKMALLVETVDFDALGEVRVHGLNRSELEYVQMNAHHTLSIHGDPPQEVTLYKLEWDNDIKRRIDDACDAEGKADTAAVCLDYGLAEICVITPSLTITKQKIETSISKKHASSASGNRSSKTSTRDESLRRFYKTVFDAVVTHIDFSQMKVLLLCSPGSIREEFRTFIKEEVEKALTSVASLDTMKDVRTTNLKALQKFISRFVLVKTSCGHRGAIREALSKKEVQQALEDTKGIQGAKVWDRFQKMMTKNPDRCVYTPQMVMEALKNDAIETLLVCDDILRTTIISHKYFYQALCNAVTSNGCGGSVVFISSLHVSGEQLMKISGIAAILRFDMPDMDDIEPDPDFLSSDRAQEMIINFKKPQGVT